MIRSILKYLGFKSRKKRILDFARYGEEDCTIMTGSTGASGKYTREVAMRLRNKYKTVNPQLNQKESGS